MRLEKTILIEFDEVREQTRIEGNFKGACRKKLLLVLAEFIAGRWPEAVEAMTRLYREELEYVHPVVFQTLSDIHQAALLARMPFEQVVFDQMRDFSGTSQGPERFAYPKYQKL